MTNSQARSTVTIESADDDLPILADIVDTIDVVAGSPTPDELAATITVLAAAASTRNRLSEGRLK